MLVVARALEGGRGKHIYCKAIKVGCMLRAFLMSGIVGAIHTCRGCKLAPRRQTVSAPAFSERVARDDK